MFLSLLFLPFSFVFCVSNLSNTVVSNKTGSLMYCISDKPY